VVPRRTVASRWSRRRCNRAVGRESNRGVRQVVHDPLVLPLSPARRRPDDAGCSSVEIGRVGPKRWWCPWIKIRRGRCARSRCWAPVQFALGIIGAIAFAVTGSVWVVAAAVILLVAGVVLLYQVGRSLPCYAAARPCVLTLPLALLRGSLWRAQPAHPQYVRSLEARISWP
jgi:hypothetical protein